MEKTENDSLKQILENYFEKILTDMEEKFVRDYDILRGYSIEYTEMYHDLYDNIIINMHHNYESINTNENHSDSVAHNQNSTHEKTQPTTRKVEIERSKTPVKLSNKMLVKKDEQSKVTPPTKANQNSPKKEPASPRNRDRSKTPVLGEKKETKPRELKRDPDPAAPTKSAHTLLTVKDIKKSEKGDKKANDNRGPEPTKVEIKPKNNREIKRDMTPTPDSKKNLNISTDNLIGITNKKQNQPSTRVVKKVPQNMKEEKKITEKRRGTDHSITDKSGLDSTSIKDAKKRNSAVVDKINLDNIKISPKSTEKKEVIEITPNFSETIKTDVKMPKMKKSAFSDRCIECLFIVSLSKVVPMNLRIKITTSVKKIYNKYGLRNIQCDIIETVENELKLYEDNQFYKYVIDPENEQAITKKFVPSKTAQNGLNFVTKEEEGNLLKQKPPNEIISIVKLIYLLINEPTEDKDHSFLFENLTSQIYPTKGVENLKSLFLNYICNNLEISDYQYLTICQIVQENPKVLSSPDLLKINRSFSYMTFILKEIYNYLTEKLPDNTPLHYLRQLYKNVHRLTEKLKKLKGT